MAPPSTLCEVDDDGKIESADGAATAENNHFDLKDEWIEENMVSAVAMLVGGFAREFEQQNGEERERLAVRKSVENVFPVWHESGYFDSMSALSTCLPSAIIDCGWGWFCFKYRNYVILLKRY